MFRTLAPFSFLSRLGLGSTFVGNSSIRGSISVVVIITAAATWLKFQHATARTAAAVAVTTSAPSSAVIITATTTRVT